MTTYFAYLLHACRAECSAPLPTLDHAVAFVENKRIVVGEFALIYGLQPTIRAPFVIYRGLAADCAPTHAVGGIDV